VTAERRHALLGAVACIAFAGEFARGASITETVPFTILAPGAVNFPAQTLHVPTAQFNPRLGTFESATTTITGTTSTALEFFTTGAGGPYDILLTDTISLGGIPALFGQELTGTLPADQLVFTLPVTFPFGPVGRSDPVELVVGSGAWNQLFSLPFPLLVITQSPATVLVPGLMISGSSVTTYTYTAAITPVPEPRSAAVLAWLFGFSFVARSKRTWCKKVWALHPERCRGEI
jgi:hypothetical protein